MKAKQAAENFTNAFPKIYGTDPNLEQALERIRLVSETASLDLVLSFSGAAVRKSISKSLEKLEYVTRNKNQDGIFYLDVSWELAGLN